LGVGVPKLALGAPPGGVHGAAPSSGHRFGSTRQPEGPWGGPGGAPGGPRGGRGGAPGAAGGVRGPLTGGDPPGGPQEEARPKEKYESMGAFPREAARGTLFY
jgi:hypothetical protein